MSGGHFGYVQYHIGEIADSIDELVRTNDSTEKNEWGDQVGRHYSADTIEKFKEAAHTLRRAHVMAQRVDWLVSGDDGEDDFRKLWASELADVATKS